MERGQTRPASGVLRSRPGRRSLGLVERVGGRRARLRFKGGSRSAKGRAPFVLRTFPPCRHQTPAHSGVPACAGMTWFAGRVRGNDVCALG